MVVEAGRVGGLSGAVQGLSLGEIAVRVQTLNGYSHVIRVSEHDSVGQLKEKIKETLDMPCEEQWLTFGGRNMTTPASRIMEYPNTALST